MHAVLCILLNTRKAHQDFGFKIFKSLLQEVLIFLLQLYETWSQNYVSQKLTDCKKAALYLTKGKKSQITKLFLQHNFDFIPEVCTTCSQRMDWFTFCTSLRIRVQFQPALFQCFFSLFRRLLPHPINTQNTTTQPKQRNLNVVTVNTHTSFSFKCVLLATGRSVIPWKTRLKLYAPISLLLCMPGHTKETLPNQKCVNSKTNGTSVAKVLITESHTASNPSR